MSSNMPEKAIEGEHDLHAVYRILVGVEDRSAGIPKSESPEYPAYKVARGNKLIVEFHPLLRDVERRRRLAGKVPGMHVPSRDELPRLPEAGPTNYELTQEGRDMLDRRPPEGSEGKAVGQNPAIWRDVRERLLRLQSSGEKYVSQANLAKLLGEKKSTVGKAIRNSSTLKAWASGPAAPRATGLNEVVAGNAMQTTEPDPSEGIPDDEVQAAMARLIDQATPEHRAELNGMNAEARRKLAAEYLAHEEDYEPSPLADDPPDRKLLRVKQPKHV